MPFQTLTSTPRHQRVSSNCSKSTLSSRRQIVQKAYPDIAKNPQTSRVVSLFKKHFQTSASVVKLFKTPIQTSPSILGIHVLSNCSKTTFRHLASVVRLFDKHTETSSTIAKLLAQKTQLDVSKFPRQILQAKCT